MKISDTIRDCEWMRNAKIVIANRQGWLYAKQPDCEITRNPHTDMELRRAWLLGYLTSKGMRIELA